MYSVLSVAFSPDGVHIVSGSQDTTARVWSARTGKLLAVAEGHSDCVWSVAFSPDGAYIVSGSTDRTVRVWDARTGKQVSLLKGHKKRVLSVGFSPDGAHIVSGSLDMTVWVWDLRTCKQLLLLKGHCNRISSVAFSSDGKYVISCDRQGNKLEWNVESVRSGKSDVLHNLLTAELPHTHNGVFKWDKETGWISWQRRSNGSPQYLCWLPLERRGGLFVWHGTTAAIGARHGAVTILDFYDVIAMLNGLEEPVK